MLDREGAGRRRGQIAARAAVVYAGVCYDIDLQRCRRALVWRQVEGEVVGVSGLAAATRLSRSTVSRFYAGRQVSLRATLRILAVLQLRFEDVAWPAGEGERG